MIKNLIFNNYNNNSEIIKRKNLKNKNEDKRLINYNTAYNSIENTAYSLSLLSNSNQLQSNDDNYFKYKFNKKTGLNTYYSTNNIIKDSNNTNSYIYKNNNNSFKNIKKLIITNLSTIDKNENSLLKKINSNYKTETKKNSKKFFPKSSSTKIIKNINNYNKINNNSNNNTIFNRTNSLPNKSKKLYLKGNISNLIHINKSKNNKKYAIINNKKIIQNHLPNILGEIKLFSPLKIISKNYIPIFRKSEINRNEAFTSINNQIIMEFNKNFSLVKEDKNSIYNNEINKILNEKKENQTIKKNKFEKILDIPFNLENYKSNDENINKKPNKKLFYKFKESIIKSAEEFKKKELNLNLFYSQIKNIKNNKIEKKKIIMKDLFIFRLAIKDYNFKKIRAILNKNPELINYKDEFGQTTFHIIAKRNIYKLIPFFYKLGEKINVKNEIGETPLHLAAKYNNLETVQFLLFYLAKPYIKNKYGKLPIDYCKNELIKGILRRANLIHRISMNYKTKFQNEIILKGLKYFFDFEKELPIKRLFDEIHNDKMLNIKK